MSETPENVVDTDAAPYTESSEHVPDPTAVYGTLDTSATAGGEHERLEGITPVFDAAKAQDLQYAADALDPDNDENTDTASVVLPDDHITNDEAKENVAAAAEAAAGVKVEDPSLAQAEKDNAAKESGDLTPNDVAAQQAQASPAGGTAGSTTATQGSAADGGTATGTATGTADTSGTGGSPSAPVAAATPPAKATHGSKAHGEKSGDKPSNK